MTGESSYMKFRLVGSMLIQRYLTDVTDFLDAHCDRYTKTSEEDGLEEDF